MDTRGSTDSFLKRAISQEKSGWTRKDFFVTHKVQITEVTISPSYAVSLLQIKQDAEYMLFHSEGSTDGGLQLHQSVCGGA